MSRREDWLPLKSWSFRRFSGHPAGGQHAAMQDIQTVSFISSFRDWPGRGLSAAFN